jgi:hypothetical protein
MLLYRREVLRYCVVDLFRLQWLPVCSLQQFNMVLGVEEVCFIPLNRMWLGEFFACLRGLPFLLSDPLSFFKLLLPLVVRAIIRIRGFVRGAIIFGSCVLLSIVLGFFRFSHLFYFFSLALLVRPDRPLDLVLTYQVKIILQRQTDISWLNITMSYLLAMQIIKT